MSLRRALQGVIVLGGLAALVLLPHYRVLGAALVLAVVVAAVVELMTTTS